MAASAVVVSRDRTDDGRPQIKRHPRKLNEALDVIGVGRFQVKIALLCGIGEFVNGMQQLSVSFLLHYLGNLFHLTNHGKALIGTVTGAGMFLGSILWGRVSDINGRRLAFTMSLLVSGLFGLLSAVSPVFAVFLIFRGLLSTGVGGNVPLAFTVFTEFSPTQNRGLYLTMLEAWWALGAVATCALAWGVLPVYGWQLFVILTSSPSFLLAVLTYFVLPETPRYQLASGRIDDAEATLDRMAVANGRLEGYTRLEDPVETADFRPPFLEIFDDEYITRTMSLFSIYFLLSFGCGVFVWMPVLLQAKNLEVMSMYRSMVIMALSQIPGVALSAFCVEHVGRRAALYTFLIGGAASMSMFALSGTRAVVIGASILMEFFLAGANGALSAFSVESYPTTLRSTGVGAASSMARLNAVISPTIWASLLDVGVKTAVFTGGASLLVAIVFVSLVPETRNVLIKDHISAAHPPVKKAT